MKVATAVGNNDVGATTDQGLLPGVKFGGPGGDNRQPHNNNTLLSSLAGGAQSNGLVAVTSTMIRYN